MRITVEIPGQEPLIIDAADVALVGWQKNGVTFRHTWVNDHNLLIAMLRAAQLDMEDHKACHSPQISEASGQAQMQTSPQDGKETQHSMTGI